MTSHISDLIRQKSKLSAGGSWNLQNPSSRAVQFLLRNDTKPVGAGTWFEQVSPGHEPGKDPLLQPAMSNFYFEKSKKSFGFCCFNLFNCLIPATPLLIYPTNKVFVWVFLSRPLNSVARLHILGEIVVKNLTKRTD